MSIFCDFVTAPYAVSGISPVKLFFDNGLLGRTSCVTERNHGGSSVIRAHRGCRGGPHCGRPGGDGLASLERNQGGPGGCARGRRGRGDPVRRQPVGSRRGELEGRDSFRRRPVHRLGRPDPVQHRGGVRSDPEHRRGCRQSDRGSRHAASHPRIRFLIVPAGGGGLRCPGGGGRSAVGRPRIPTHAGRRGAAGGPCLGRDDGNAVDIVPGAGDGDRLFRPGPGAVDGGTPGDCLPAHRIRRGAHPCGVPAYPPLFRGDPGARPVHGAGPVRAGLFRVFPVGKLRGGHGRPRGEPGRGAARAGGAGELRGTLSQLAGTRGAADAASRPDSWGGRRHRWDFTWRSPPITR